MALDKTVLMIMVDALRHDYITEEDSPFLYRLAQQGAHGSLIPSFGFEPDGAYFAGLDPEECDGGAQYWRKPNDRVFYFTGLFRILNLLPFARWQNVLRKAIRLTAQLMAKDPMTRKMAPPNRIPLDKLDQFSFPMTHFAHQPGFTPSPSLFDIARHNDLDFLFHGHPLYKVKTPKVVERYINDDHGQHAFAFLFMGDLDSIGHRFGPDSAERRAMLRKIDSAISSIYRHAQKHYRETDLLVFGDHGMVAVDGILDSENIRRHAEADSEVDSYFLDSTFARFWLKQGAAGNHLREFLGTVSGGHTLTDMEIEDYRIRFPHNYFGDIIFAVDNAKLIHPSFYSDSAHAPRGMHGYLPGCRDNESAFILSSARCTGAGNLGRVDMRRVFPTILDLLAVPERNSAPHGLTSFVP